MEMLEEFGGCTKVTSCSQSTILLQTAVVLASLIPGLRDAGWQATQLTHKQLKNTNLRHPHIHWAYTYKINKEETPPCMFHSPTPQGTLR